MVYVTDFFEAESFESRYPHMVEFARDGVVLREGGAFCFGCGGWFVFDGRGCWVFSPRYNKSEKDILVKNVIYNQ